VVVGVVELTDDVLVVATATSPHWNIRTTWRGGCTGSGHRAKTRKPRAVVGSPQSGERRPKANLPGNASEGRGPRLSPRHVEVIPCRHTDLPPHGMETSATTPKWSDAHKPVEVLAVVPMRVARAVLTAGVIVRIKSMRIEAVDVGLSRSAACPHVSPGSLRLASLQESRIASVPGEITVTAARASCI
jgi:hypothetical protein